MQRCAFKSHFEKEEKQWYVKTHCSEALKGYEYMFKSCKPICTSLLTPLQRTEHRRPHSTARVSGTSEATYDSVSNTVLADLR